MQEHVGGIYIKQSQNSQRLSLLCKSESKKRILMISLLFALILQKSGIKRKMVLLLLMQLLNAMQKKYGGSVVSAGTFGKQRRMQENGKAVLIVAIM